MQDQKQIVFISGMIGYPALEMYKRLGGSVSLQAFRRSSQLETVHDSLPQRFSNFFDHGPLFSSGIVGGPPHLLQ